MSEVKEMTVGALADLFGGAVEGDASRLVTGPAGLDVAGPDDVSFLAQESYAPQLATTRAGAVLVGKELEVERDDLVLVRCEDPERAFTEVILAFAPDDPRIPAGVDPTASVHPSAQLDATAGVGPNATVGAGAVLGPRVQVHAGASVGANARVDEDTVLMPCTVLYPRTRVGARCILHAGVVLGGHGFGFHFNGEAWQKTPQVGHVTIEDDVEIGSNSAVDCGRFGATRIGAGTKIDNLVHVAHNVQIGRGCLLLAHVGIAGSTVIEDGVILAGQAGVAGHIRIGKGARIMGGAGVTKDVPPGEQWFGYPAGPSGERMRKIIGAERAGTDVRALKKELRALRRELEALKGPQGGAPADGVSSGNDQ